MKSEWVEIPVFIHGIVAEKYPKSHNEEYNYLFQLINKELKSKGKSELEKPIKVEWGWDSGRSETKDKYLAEAERQVVEEVEKILGKVKDLIFIFPLRRIHNVLRQEFLLGFADMFYYVSKDGEEAVRNNVFNCICREINSRKTDKSTKISLTFIAHSAGTVIVHDFLYHLFRKEVETQKFIKKEIDSIRRLVATRRLRIRKFYTMGSPITPMMFRAHSLLEKIINKQQLDPNDIGLRETDRIPNPRWVNFWDKDDIVSFPVTFFYKKAEDNKAVVEDKYIDLGDIFPKTHITYWKSRELARNIAQNF